MIFYLRSERNCANNTVVKYIKNFGKIINICLNNRWLNEDPFAKYKAKVKEIVRDIFIFSCFTGLAYIDVKQLSNDNISIRIDGDKWIFKIDKKQKLSQKFHYYQRHNKSLKKKSSDFCKSKKSIANPFQPKNECVSKRNC